MDMSDVDTYQQNFTTNGKKLAEAARPDGGTGFDMRRVIEYVDTSPLVTARTPEISMEFALEAIHEVKKVFGTDGITIDWGLEPVKRGKSLFLTVYERGTKHILLIQGWERI